MTADNFQFDLTGVPLYLALQVAAVQCPKAKSWRVDEGEGGVPRLVLRWIAGESGDESVPLAAPLENDALLGFVQAWLDDIEYPAPTDPWQEVHREKGFRAYVNHWGFVDDDHYAFIAIEPAWLLHGK